MRSRGFTRTELVVVLCVIAAVIAYLTFVLNRARTGALSAYDANQVGEVHRANVIFANDNEGRYMIPGLVNRLPIPQEFRSYPASATTPAMGPEDHTLNTTPNMYSALIAQQFFRPQLTVGPTEVNPNVVVKEDYNHAAYNPQFDMFWDDTFRVDIETPGGEAHASYAHLAIGGVRKAEMWRDTQAGSQPVFGTRGPRNGAEQGEAYDTSLTLQLHGPNDRWDGNICFNDNHVEMLTSFYPVHTKYATSHDVEAVPDNIFAAEFAVHLEHLCSQHTNPELAGDAFLLIYDGIEHWPSADWARCVRSFNGRYD